MMQGTKLVAAMTAAYLLGRRSKGLLALVALMWVMNKKRSGEGKLGEGLRGLTGRSPGLTQLVEHLRGPMVAAAQRAVTATVESGASALADSMERRASALGGKPKRGTEIAREGEEEIADQSEERGAPDEKATGEDERLSASKDAARETSVKRPDGAERAGREPQPQDAPSRKPDRAREPAGRGSALK